MRVLLVGSSFSAAPLLFILKKAGAQVTVIGRDPGDPCHIHADESIIADYSDRDSLLNICARERYDYIVPSCNDYAYMAATYVASHLGYPGYDAIDTAVVLHTKDAYRSLLEKLHIPSPRKYCELSPDVALTRIEVPTPAILKPVDSFSGRGVEIIQNADEIEAAARRAFAASRAKRAVVEQFVEGQLHSHTAFIASGRIWWHDFVDEYCEVYPFAVDRSRYPSTLSAEMKRKVNESICTLVANLKLSDGLIHTQFISDAKAFYIIESMRRCPGDLYGHQMKLAAGMDYAALYVAPFINRNYDVTATLPTPSVAVERLVLTVDQARPFFGLTLPLTLASAEFIPLKNSGEVLRESPIDKAGILFYTYPSEAFSEMDRVSRPSPIGYE